MYHLDYFFLFKNVLNGRGWGTQKNAKYAKIAKKKYTYLSYIYINLTLLILNDRENYIFLLFFIKKAFNKKFL